MDIKQAWKIVILSPIFFIAGLIVSLGIIAASNGEMDAGGFGIGLLIAYAISALPLSIIRLKGLRASGNRGEFGLAGGYLAGGGAEGNGCTVATAFLVGRWAMNWIICIFALFYWFPKSIITIIRNSHNKKSGSY